MHAFSVALFTISYGRVRQKTGLAVWIVSCRSKIHITKRNNGSIAYWHTSPGHREGIYW
jgi:hypothetical protein